jgi:hypothetical protein
MNKAFAFKLPAISAASSATSRRSGSAIELTETCLSAIEDRNAFLNVFLSVDKEGALAQARRADEAAAAGSTPGPYAEFSFDEPIANSSQLSLPRMTAPASTRRRTAVAV